MGIVYFGTNLLDGDEYVIKLIEAKTEDKKESYFDKKLELSSEQIIKILSQIVDGMSYLYEVLKIAHCDVKPDHFL